MGWQLLRRAWNHDAGFCPNFGRWLTRGAAQNRRGLMFRGGAPLACRVPPASLREVAGEFFALPSLRHYRDLGPLL